MVWLGSHSETWSTSHNCWHLTLSLEILTLKNWNFWFSPRNSWFSSRNYREICNFYRKIHHCTAKSVILAAKLPRNLVTLFVAVPRNLAKFTAINFCLWMDRKSFQSVRLSRDRWDNFLKSCQGAGWETSKNTSGIKRWTERGGDSYCIITNMLWWVATHCKILILFPANDSWGFSTAQL